MRITKKLCRILMWIVFIWTLLAQVLAIIGISTYTPEFNTIEIILSLALLIIGMLLFTILKKKRIIGLCVAIVSLVFCVIAAIKISDTFIPERFAENVGEHVALTPNLSNWDLVFRHLTNFVVVALMGILWKWERDAQLQAKREAAGEYVSQYDLSGDAIFSDKPAQSHPVKRSVRARQEKQASDAAKEKSDTSKKNSKK